MTDRRSRIVGATIGALGGTVVGALLPLAVEAHQLTERYASPLPLAAYVLGAAAAVALSFGFVVIRSGGGASVADRSEPRAIGVPRPVRTILRALGLGAWLWVVVQGITGAFGDEADAPSLFLWVYGWVGLSLVSALIGPAWRWIDPFTTIFDLLAAIGRRVGLHGPATLPYPAVLRRWPAVAGYATFVWLELVVEGARAGRLLSALLVLYTLMLVGRGVGLSALGAGLLPIAVGYLIAHYLTYLLFDGQRIVAPVNDPLNRGATLLGIDEFQSAQAWLPAAAAWGIQLAAVVGGHMIGAWAGHRASLEAAAREAPSERAPETARAIWLWQLPLAALMVGLASLTLWSLGQVIVEHL